MKTALEKLKNKYYLIIGDDVTKAQNDVLEELDERLSELELVRKCALCNKQEHATVCDECADDAAPKTANISGCTVPLEPCSKCGLAWVLDKDIRRAQTKKDGGK
jgi:hypothetical protein